MKHIIWLLSLFIFSNPTLQSQAPSKIVLTTKGTAVMQATTVLPSPVSTLQRNAILPIPIYKLPESFDKKYLIRVFQSDIAIFQKFIKDLPVGMYYHRGFDHKGYDYFLPVAFNKEDQAKSYLTQLKGPLYKKAVVVKNIPKNVKCNCFSRF